MLAQRSSLRAPRWEVVLLAALGVAAPLELGCSGAKDARSAEADAQAAIASTDTRIRGAWVLQSFVPEDPLEPMLKAMLEFQFGRLVIRLDGKRLVADSPGVHVERTYQITEAKGDQFKLTTFDAQGVPYESTCMFQMDGRVQVHSTSDPWRGLAMISRAGP